MSAGGYENKSISVSVGRWASSLASVSLDSLEGWSLGQLSYYATEDALRKMQANHSRIATLFS